MIASVATGISWGPLLSHSGALAIGPHVTDPRSGETLDADIVIDSGWLNIYLRFAAA